MLRAKHARHCKRDEGRWFAVATVVMMVVSFLVTSFYVGVDPAAGGWRPDSFRFLELARSIAAGDGMSVAGAPSDYQKLGFPLMCVLAVWLSPDNLQQQTLIITYLNAACVAIATGMLALVVMQWSDRFDERTLMLGAGALFLPAMQADGIASESLFLVFVFALIAVVMRAMTRRNQWAWSVFAGAILYLAYLTREIGCVLALGAIIYWIVLWRQGECSGRWVVGSVVLMLGTFAALFAVAKLTVFAGTGNTYNQFNLDKLDMYHIGYGLGFALPMNLLSCFIVCWGVFLVYPIAAWGKLDRQSRGMAVMAIAMLVCLAVIVTCTISISEDILAGRMHRNMVRYFDWVVPLLVCVCAKTWLVEHKPSAMAVGIAVGVSCVFVTMFACMVDVFDPWTTEDVVINIANVETVVYPAVEQDALALAMFPQAVVSVGMLILGCVAAIVMACGGSRRVVLLCGLTLMILRGCYMGGCMVLQQQGAEYDAVAVPAVEQVHDEAVRLVEDGKSVGVGLCYSQGRMDFDWVYRYGLSDEQFAYYHRSEDGLHRYQANAAWYRMYAEDDVDVDHMVVFKGDFGEDDDLAGCEWEWHKTGYLLGGDKFEYGIVELKR